MKQKKIENYYQLNSLIIPVIMLILLGIGLFAATRLTGLRQILKSRASLDRGAIELGTNKTTIIGQEFEIPVMLSLKGQEIVAADVVLSFDKNSLELTDITLKPGSANNKLTTYLPKDSNNGFNKAKVLQAASSTGKIEFSAVCFSAAGCPQGQSQDLKETNPLALLKFKTLKTGNTAVNVLYSPGKTNNSNLITRAKEQIISNSTPLSITVTSKTIVISTPSTTVVSNPPAFINTNTPAPTAPPTVRATAAPTVSGNTTAVLTAPTNPTQVCNGTTVNLSWTAGSGASDYAVRVNKEPYADGMGPGDEMQGATTTSLSLPIVPNAKYQWRVASRANGKEESSPEVIFTCPGTYNTPVLVGRCDQGVNLKLAWSSVAGASKYLLRVDDTANGWGGYDIQPGDIVEDNITATSYTSNKGQAGHNYQVWVHSVNSSNNLSEASNKITVSCR